MEIGSEWEVLPKETIRQFDEEGCLIVRKALDVSVAARLEAAGDRAIESDARTNRQTRDEGRYDACRNCIALDDAFRSLLVHERIFPIVVQLMGAYLHLTTSHLIYKHPDPEGTSAITRMPHWHRDYGRLTQDLGHAAVPRAMVKCAYFITDLSEPNSGATLLLPGSNLLREPIVIPEGQADPEGHREPLLEPGDCLIFENRTWHAGAVNLSQQTRKVVMFGYREASPYPIPVEGLRKRKVGGSWILSRTARAGKSDWD